MKAKQIMNDAGWRAQCSGDQRLGHQCLEEGPPAFLFQKKLPSGKIVQTC